MYKERMEDYSTFFPFEVQGLFFFHFVLEPVRRDLEGPAVGFRRISGCRIYLVRVFCDLWA